MYEIASKKSPHDKMELFEAAIQIRDGGLTPTFPPETPESIIRVAKSCWEQEPTKRPTFKELCQMLHDVI